MQIAQMVIDKSFKYETHNVLKCIRKQWPSGEDIDVLMHPAHCSHQII